jgi:hypothetical protein
MPTLKSNYLSKLTKVNDNLTINRYDNGWMVEVGGKNAEGDWKTTKVLCNSEDDLLLVIREYNSMEVDD